MSEFVHEQFELPTLPELYDNMCERAQAFIGNLATKFSAENKEEGDGTAEANEDDSKIVTDETKAKPDGTEVTVHTESMKPGTAGPGTGEGQPIKKN